MLLAEGLRPGCDQLKFRGVDTDIDFTPDDYKEGVNKVSGCSKEEFVQVLRLGVGFVWGSSRFPGRHPAQVQQVGGQDLPAHGQEVRVPRPGKKYSKMVMDERAGGVHGTTDHRYSYSFSGNHCYSLEL